MKLKLPKKLVVSVGFILFLFFVYLTVDIFAGEWLSSKIDDLTYGYFKIGAIDGISLNRGVEHKIDLNMDEHIELLANINTGDYTALEQNMQSNFINYLNYQNESYQTNSFGTFVFIPYELAYSGHANSVDAYVRLNPTSSIGNEVIIDGIGVPCYQYVFYMDGNYPVPLSRIGFNKETSSYYYYPKPLEKDAIVNLVYALYFPGDVYLPSDISCLDLKIETIYAKNNLMAINWNVLFDGNTAASFESSMSAEIPYNNYFIDIQAIIDNAELINIQETDEKSDEELSEETEQPNESGEPETVTEPNIVENPAATESAGSSDE